MRQVVRPASELISQPALFSYGPHEVYEIDAGVDPTELPRVSLSARAKALSNAMDAFSARNKAEGASNSPEKMQVHYGMDSRKMTEHMHKKAAYLEGVMTLAANVLIGADYMSASGATMPEIKAERSRMIQDLTNEYGASGPGNASKRSKLVERAKSAADPNSSGWPLGVNTYQPTHLAIRLKRHLK